MKRLLREIFVNAFSLYLTSNFLKGLAIKDGIETYLLAGLFFTVGEIIIKPILKVITLPFNLLTLGLFSSLINVAILYIITIFYNKIQITAFNFAGFSYRGLTIPEFYVSLLLSYFIISATIYFIRNVITWIFNQK